MSTYLTVTGTEQLTPSMIRVRFSSADLSAFADSHFTDRYLKLVFPKPGVVYPRPLDLRALRGQVAPEDMPVIRTYTALQPDVANGTLAVDFVVHGDTGVAGPWAAAAKPGDELVVVGPGGAYRPDPSADWHLLVGDESAVPAITAALEVLPSEAEVRVFVLVDSPAYEPKIPTHARVSYLHRPDSLLDAVAGMDWLPGRVHAFVHGEAAETMQGLRPHLLKERGLSRDQVSVSGYWRRGDTEDAFQAWKAAQRD